LQRGVSNGNTMENSVRIVKGEIHNVLSLMRLNRRYSSASRFHREIPATAESPLVRELKALHDSFASYSDLQDMDTLVWPLPRCSAWWRLLGKRCLVVWMNLRRRWRPNPSGKCSLSVSMSCRCGCAPSST